MLFGKLEADMGKATDLHEMTAKILRILAVQNSHLSSEVAKVAVQESIGNALLRYATGTRLMLARPFMQKNGLLTDPEVSAEFAVVLTFDRQPNTQLIGGKWQAALDQPLRWRDLSQEAEIILRYFENELKNTEVFRSVFQSKNLSVIKTNTAATAERLSNIEERLGSIVDLMDARFGELSRHFLDSSTSIRDEIRDFTRYIEEKTRGFVGRQFVFDAVQQFIDTHPRGYFFVRGDPGIGKSALAAQMVKTNGYLHHFNIRSEGINKATDFLKNICAQLIAVYDLDYAILPPETTQDGRFLGELLDQVSKKLNGKKCVIVVDALDGADQSDVPSGENILCLPTVLQDGIYIVATTRREQLPVRIDISEQGSLYLEQDAAGNVEDITLYVEGQTPQPGIQAYIQRHRINDSVFIQHIVGQSQGNFIYLRMVLPEIETGAYTDLELNSIPAGLNSYYEDHWRRMRQQNELDWFDDKLPVIVALTVVKEPVSIDLITDFSDIEDKRRIRAVLKDFDQFIFKTDVEYEGSTQRRYRWYHDSFFEFIAATEDVADERVDLVQANKKIADNMWGDLGLDEETTRGDIGAEQSHKDNGDWSYGENRMDSLADKLSIMNPEKKAYLLQTLVNHLVYAGNIPRAYLVLTKTSDWLDVQFDFSKMDSQYEIQLRNVITHIGEPKTPQQICILVGLYCANHILLQRAAIRGEHALVALAYMDKVDLAFDYASRKSNIFDRFSSFLTICEIAGANVLQKEMPRLEETIDAIPYLAERNEAYLKFAAILAKFNFAEDANRYLDKSTATALALQDYERKLVALDSISEILLSTNEFTLSETLRKYKRSAETEGDAHLKRSAIDFAQQGLFDEAQELINKIQSADLRFDTTQQISKLLATSGKLAKALAVLEVRSVDDLLNTLGSWAMIFEREERGLSLKIMREAIRIIAWIRDDWSEVHRIISIDEDEAD